MGAGFLLHLVHQVNAVRHVQDILAEYQAYTSLALLHHHGIGIQYHALVSTDKPQRRVYMAIFQDP